MARANWHQYQVLTKRSTRLRDLLRTKLRFAAKLRHIWWGVSVENRKHGLPRIDDLRDATAGIRFLSIEPLLEDLGQFNLAGIDWVIVGGESGAGARPIDEDWVLSIRAQCKRAKVPFFFKQWGGIRKSENGRTLAGRTYDGFPRIPFLPVIGELERKSAIAELNQLYETGLYHVGIRRVRAIAG
jgi:protein gp37